MLEPNSPSKIFSGVRFVLYGFDLISERQVRAKLLNGGGLDAGQYNQNCTHVIVDRIVYDDPRCVNARNDGKAVVTGLWVDHSCDIGVAVDPTAIMYIPPRDLNGIPGAKNLVLCLTGYQRNDREDIMTMVSLIGAQFSKPLVANKVTHLICYKFEGEKFELANKLKKIKLVNHRWLEDCLRYWELLPEGNYGKSGYEIEMMEAEAKDSEEDAKDISEKQSTCKVNKSPELKVETLKPSPLPKSTKEVHEAPRNSSEPEGLPVLAKDKLISSRSTSDLATGSNSNPEVAFQTGPFIFGTSVGIPDPQERTPTSRKRDSGSESVSRSSDAKFSDISNMKKAVQKSPSSLFSVQHCNIRSSKVQLGEHSSISSARGEYGKSTVESGHAEYVQGEAFSSKRQKTDVSFPNSKQQDIHHDAQATVTESPSVSSRTQLEPESLVNGLFNINDNCSLSNNGHTQHDMVSPNIAQKLHAGASSAKASTFGTKSFTQGPKFQENMQETTHENLNGETPDTFSKAAKPEGGHFKVEKSAHMVVGAEGLLHQQRDKQVLSPFNRKSEEKTQIVANMEEPQEGSGNLIPKSGRKKTVARRTWGSRRAYKSTCKQKGTIYSHKTASRNDPQMVLSGDAADNEKSVHANKPEILPAAVNVGKEAETKIGKSSEDDVQNEINFLDNETESPEDKDESTDVISEEKAEVPDLSHKVADNILEIEPEGFQHLTNNIGSRTDSIMKEEDVTQLQQRDEPTCKENSTKRKVCRGKKQATVETRTKIVLNVSEELESKNVLDREGILDGKNIKVKTMKKSKTRPSSAECVKSRSVSGKNAGSSAEIEKENKPIVAADQNIGRVKNYFGKRVTKVSMNFQQESRKGNPTCTPKGEDKELEKAEPLWFILSGHRLQRKEFQQVIKRLKGKFCRDSHQWSYQATHFIAPDPIRRTEKFFAAAATGRWILKTDYLSACGQAGKFLDEEPYEWHKTGLSEDGAINLEAPRKWRLLREKTGHGAFHGMRIVIYGECIAPPLDTLKRVVKAGDGTILATSPPYTRFLASGIDYAIISPGMPHVDIWVQEFLRHEIPCVVADYLVDYVCKPGYSLERHVLYNTHPWAEKSLAKLLSKAEEIVDHLTPSDDCSDNDIACVVCESRDRGEVMLICGDENGSSGCGKGMHIDCCDPPFENIPEDDWFCPNCSNSNGSNSNISSMKRRNGTSTLKTK